MSDLVIQNDGKFVKDLYLELHYIRLHVYI